MAQLQEAQFACFEDEEFDSSSTTLLNGGFGGGGDFTLQHQQHQSGLKTFAIAEPSGVARGLPQKSFARVRSLECSGSGSFYFQNEALKDRFVCWRVIKNIVVLREWSLHETLAGNGIRLQFPAPVVGTGVFAVESWEGNSVTICVVTHAGTIHRFTYAIPATASHSIFTTADASFPPKPATSSKCDVVASLSPDEIITVALWVNEYNLVLGADSGRVIGVNFGLPSSPPNGSVEMQEFAFSDESVVKWLWNGLVKSSAAKWQGNDDSKRQANSIVAITCFPIESEIEDEADDVCIVTVSADLTLRAWSYASQSCLGKQEIRSLVNADFEDEGLPDAYAVNAKIVALSATSTDNCRLLVHIDTTANFSQDIFLLRGDVSPLPTGGRRELTLAAARMFTVDSPSSSESQSKRLKIVDFAVDKNYLYSSWRSASGDFVYSHSNPMALTGPRIIRGEVVSSLNAQMQKYDMEDDEWPFDLKDESVLELTDNFFVERVLLPGRFSRQNLYKAILEYHGDLEIPLRPLFSSAANHQESKYRDLLVKIVSDKLLSVIGNSSSNVDGLTRHTRDPNLLRISIWKSIIELCNKHWRVENVPIGFATTANSLLPGSPVLLRRNRVALLFPSASAITTPFLSKLSSNSADCVRELAADILPVFDGFPSRSFQSFIHREVTDVVSDWKVESFVALARHCVRMGLKAGLGSTDSTIINPDLVLTRALLRLSKILGGETEFHDQVLRDLVEHLFPFELSKDGSSSNSPSPKKRHESYDDDDEDHAMEDDESINGSASISRNLFGGNEISFAFEQVAARTIDEMCTQALRVVLFLSYLVDSQPAFLNSAILRNVSRFYLPRSITIYQRWRLSKWIASQNIAHATEIDSSSARASATLLPPLLQLFLLEANSRLNSSGALKRARSVLQIAMMNNNVQSEEAHSVLGSFTREILRYVSQPNDPLVKFLQKRKQFSLLRSMFSCSLSDVSLHGIKYESPDQNPEVQRYVRSIGECLAREGQIAAKANDKEHALWCFQQAIRCFSICLSSFLSDHDEPHSFDSQAERFIYDIIGLLKETIPRGYFSHMLGFLWTVVAQALNRSGEGDSALQTFVWVNVFKYSVEERLFRDAHLALMHTLDVTSSALTSQMTDGDEDSEGENGALSTSAECVNYLVKELCRYGHLDLLCEFQWGPLEPEVEKHIQWQAANANVVKNGSVDPAVIMYHNLLFAFYSRKQQPANAAAAMHSLYLRLRLAQMKSSTSLQAQRNALYAATNSLLALPEMNRWIVRKYHAEELMNSSRKSAVVRVADAKENLPLNIVTAHDFAREIAVLDGKLRLLHLGHDESVLLSTMDGEEVVALLVDSALSCCEWINSTKLEKQQESSLAIELAVDIVKKSATSYSNIIKSMTRYCVAVAHSVGLDSLCWHMLQDCLIAIDSLEQYEVAAATILEWKVKIVLPAWLYDRLAHPKLGNPAKLLKLYLKYGLLLDAVKLADQMIPDELLDESEASFHQRVTAPSASLPWIPYNLFDAVLDSTDAALRNGMSAGGFGAKVTGSSEAVLRGSVQRFKEKLTSYFKYITLLEEARAAAGVAKNASVGRPAAGAASGFSFGVPIRSAGAL